MTNSADRLSRINGCLVLPRIQYKQTRANSLSYLTISPLLPPIPVYCSNRWAQSKTNDLQSAWFNGAGYESWENVWGTWNGITPRDGEAIRRVAAMLRFFGGKTTGNEVDDFLHSPDWEPHAPRALQSGVYIGKFPGASNTSAAGDTLYTLVNREGQNQTGGQTMFFPNASIEPDTRVFDCYNGKELTFESAEPQPTPGSIPKSYNLYSGSNAYEPET